MTVSDSIPKKKLKIKIASKKIEAVPSSEACEVSQQLWMNDDCVRYITLNENKESLTTKSLRVVRHSLDSSKIYAADSLEIITPTKGSSKRVPPEIMDSSKGKRQKMDHSVKQQCGSILETLIKHPASVGFREPVDPVKLNIPDYFTIISTPMDLGTIQTKLENNMYFSVEEFIADVRLTFSNAMLYNPPFNYFNKMAKKLDSMFSSKWKSLEAKWKRESMYTDDNRISSCSERKTQEAKISPRRSPVHGNSLPTMSMPTEEKRKLTKGLLEAMRGKMTEKLRMFLQQHEIRQHGVETKINGFDDSTVQELMRLVKGSLNARAAKVEPAKTKQNRKCPSGIVFREGTVSCIKSTCGSVKTLVTTSCRSCGSLRCHCSIRNDDTCANDLSSERPFRQDFGVSKMENEIKSRPMSNTTTKSDPESDGAVSVLDEENVCSSPQRSNLCATASFEDGWTPVIDVQLSPKKALRAAMLKSRFADTILKAKQKTLQEHDDKVDPMKLQQEKEKLERQQQEEKARIEAQIRAAEAAAILRAQEELRMRREREREAFRMALEKMEKTVEIDDNLKILKELEMYIRCMSRDQFFDLPDKSEGLLGVSTGGNFRNPLERLGLFIKDDYMGYEDEEDEVVLHDGEEGEFFP